MARRPYPLGATFDGRGVNFALFSANAEKVELCLFDPRGQREIERVCCPSTRTRSGTATCRTSAGPALRLPRLWALRPEGGHRFNHHKLLLDPYAKQLVGQLHWADAHFGYRIGSRREDLAFDTRDNARGMPKCRVVDTAFTWGDDKLLNTPWHESVLYETHLRGFTMLHPSVPTRSARHLRRLLDARGDRPPEALGVTAVEFLPVHAFVQDRHLVERRLSNYWGYNSIGFFAPEPRYLATGDLAEWKAMVAACTMPASR